MLSFAARAEGPKADTFKVGALFGNVALTNDGTTPDIGKNSIGLGAIFGYSIEDELSFEFSYITSDHDDLDHKDLSLGVNYYFNSYEPFYYNFSGGASFTENELSGATATGKDSAFGLYAGVGADVFTKRDLIIGLQARYYKMFSSEKSISTVNYNIVDDYYTVMARMMFQF